MTKSTITREQAQKIIVAADEVITALAGTNEDVHPDDSKKMCELWDDLNDRHAPPVVVRELARMALAAMDSEPVAFTEKHEISNMHATGLYLRAWPADRARNAVEGYTIPLYTTPQPISLVNSEPVAYIFKHPAGRLFWALTDKSNKGQNDVMPVYASPQPVPVVPDGYVMVPKVPSQAHLNSIAMRYRHDFYLLNDAQKDSALATARQMYEECSGQGFYTLPAAPQEVK